MHVNVVITVRFTLTVKTSALCGSRCTNKSRCIFRKLCSRKMLDRQLLQHGQRSESDNIVYISIHNYKVHTCIMAHLCYIGLCDMKTNRM